MPLCKRSLLLSLTGVTRGVGLLHSESALHESIASANEFDDFLMKMSILPAGWCGPRSPAARGVDPSIFRPDPPTAAFCVSDAIILIFLPLFQIGLVKKVCFLNMCVFPS